ncbi:hypothetical protein BC827DRAFT_1204620 [Russula dissimulans]|nr:hypothetical protein BC827DRAFT_1204620 [Russula dissimulans]
MALVPPSRPHRRNHPGPLVTPTDQNELTMRASTYQQCARIRSRNPPPSAGGQRPSRNMTLAGLLEPLPPPWSVFPMVSWARSTSVMHQDSYTRTGLAPPRSRNAMNQKHNTTLPQQSETERRVLREYPGTGPSKRRDILKYTVRF